MSDKNFSNKIVELKKVLLSLFKRVKFFEVKNDNGLSLLFDSSTIKVGDDVFVKNNEDITPAPDGEYIIAVSSAVIAIQVAGGKIVSITNKETGESIEIYSFETPENTGLSDEQKNLVSSENQQPAETLAIPVNQSVAKKENESVIKKDSDTFKIKESESVNKKDVDSVNKKENENIKLKEQEKLINELNEKILSLEKKIEDISRVVLKQATVQHSVTKKTNNFYDEIEEYRKKYYN